MNDIMRFVAKRLCIGVLVVLFVSVLVFAIMQAMPGNPVDLMVDTRVSAEKVAEIKAQWGLDEPPVVQYFYWIKNVLHGADAYRCGTSDRIHNRDSARLIGGGQKKQRRGQVAYGHDHRALVDAAVLAGRPVYPDLFRLAENFADFGLGRLRLFDFAGIYFSTAGAGTNLQIDALRGAGRSG